MHLLSIVHRTGGKIENRTLYAVLVRVTHDTRKTRVDTTRQRRQVKVLGSLHSISDLCVDETGVAN